MKNITIIIVAITVLGGCGPKIRFPNFNYKIEGWSTHRFVDTMRDSYTISMSKEEILGYEKAFVSFTVWETEGLMCISDHDFPGEKAAYRIDKSRMETMRETGCVTLNAELEERLRKGSILKIEHFKWPYSSRRIAEINLSGFGRNLNRARDIVRKVKENPNITDRDLFGVSE